MLLLAITAAFDLGRMYLDPDGVKGRRLRSVKYCPSTAIWQLVPGPNRREFTALTYSCAFLSRDDK